MDSDEIDIFLRYLIDSKTNKIRDMLSDGFNPNYTDQRNGNTALKVILGQGNLEILKLFIESGADVNQRINYKSRVDGREEFGYTPLFYATEVEAIDQLITHGADVNARADDGETVLMRLSRSPNSLQAIQALVLAGADTKLQDSRGMTALDIARKTNFTYIEVAKIDGKKPIKDALKASDEILKLLSESIE